MFNIVFIIPTGIGATIGGHAGDASTAATLIASCCDQLIIHPNVYNASDINEMTENALYVEGSMIDRFLRGEIELKKVYSNKVLVVVNSPLKNEIVNAVSAARATIGINAEILVLDTPLRMVGGIENNRAIGKVFGWKELIRQVQKYDFDALAINTYIDIDRDVKLNYFKNSGINPWGKVEAICSSLVSKALNKPVAHAPTIDDDYNDKELFDIPTNQIVDPRIAPEVLSMTFLHCILKGLHKAPRIGWGLSVKDVDCLITPIGCVGEPHRACIERGIPVIAVRENKTCLNDVMPKEFIFVENYLEAAGLIVAMKAGVSRESISRPLGYTKVLN